MGTLETGCIGVNDLFAGRNLPFSQGFVDDLGQVVADDLRKTGGIHCDDVRSIDSKNVVDGFKQVRLTAKDRCAFGKGTGSGHYGVLIVPGKGTSVVCTAP